MNEFFFSAPQLKRDPLGGAQGSRNHPPMTLQVWLLLGFVVTLVFVAFSLWLGRRDTTAAGQRARFRVVGIGIMVCIIPARLFVEPHADEPITGLAYVLLLLALVGSGLRFFFRGRGWSEWP
jgi:hypothetical protein